MKQRITESEIRQDQTEPYENKLRNKENGKSINQTKSMGSLAIQSHAGLETLHINLMERKPNKFKLQFYSKK